MQENSKAGANCESPKCDSCESGKGHHLSNKVNTTKNNYIKGQDLKKDNILPGQIVSADQYILRDTGRLYHKKGKSYPSDMFSGGCVFIDYSSVYVSIKHQVAINSNEKFNEELTFDREAQSQGLAIKGYYTDNGIINDSEFMEELLEKYQKIRFNGDGPHIKMGQHISPPRR